MGDWSDVMQQMRQRVQDHDQYMTQQMLDDGGDSALDVSHVLQLGPGSSILYEQGVEIITYGCYKYPDIRSLNKSEVREGCYSTASGTDIDTHFRHEFIWGITNYVTPYGSHNNPAILGFAALNNVKACWNLRLLGVCLIAPASAGVAGASNDVLGQLTMRGEMTVTNFGPAAIRPGQTVVVLPVPICQEDGIVPNRMMRQVKLNEDRFVGDGMKKYKLYGQTLGFDTTCVKNHIVRINQAIGDYLETLSQEVEDFREDSFDKYLADFGGTVLIPKMNYPTITPFYILGQLLFAQAVARTFERFPNTTLATKNDIKKCILKFLVSDGDGENAMGAIKLYYMDTLYKDTETSAIQTAFNAAAHFTYEQAIDEAAMRIPLVTTNCDQMFSRFKSGTAMAHSAVGAALIIHLNTMQ